MKRCNVLLFIVFLFSLLCSVGPGSSLAEDLFDVDSVSLQGVAPDEVDSVLARLSDEQVRSLLVAELARNTEKGGDDAKARGGMVQKATGWLHLLDKDSARSTERVGLFASISSIPSDCLAIAQQIGNGSLRNFIFTIVLLVAVFFVAYIAEFIVRRFTANFRKQFKERAIPDLDGPMKLIAGTMRSIPAFIHIMFFVGGAVVLFLFIPLANEAAVRYLFLTILFVLAFYRTLSQFSIIIFAPQTQSLRILPVNDATAIKLHRGVVLLCSYTFTAIMSLALLMELQMGKSSFLLVVIVLATLLIAMIITMILRSHCYVRDRILQKSELNKSRNWIVEQFAQFWHIPTIFYFTVIWAIMVGDQINGIQREGSAFLLSLLILPLFIFFDGIGQWVVRVSVKTLRIYNPTEGDLLDEELKVKLAEAKERERKFLVTASRIVRLAVLGALLIWVLSLWGHPVPYAVDITQAVFESLVTIALGLVVWRFASSYIEKKIIEATPEEENSEEKDDEFGGARKRGRGYTILPMVRKFIATTLLLMVTLVVLSAIGVDIGPLLAGAGVVGLAVGFGAQKLVSDVFSGFFYLLDDAFRVGEYIKAGAVSGSVESITLRNVMLRHHRGMLQIVPHSDMGSITNFMRGGIIVKFNLEFPYDANVNKIRKIIKKVGLAMLEDEEFSKDFIRPIKSAGVREITASVMVIRVKFKAQPGTHFVIRREAYRRITEALAKKGIYYAHRKVIVELPKEENSELSEKSRDTLKAGAAAAVAQMEDDEKKKAGNQKSDDLM